MTLTDKPRHLLDDARSRPRSIDEQMSRPPQMPSEERDSAERVLRDDPQLIGERAEEDRDVVDALMIRGEDVAARRIEALEAADPHPHPGRLQDQPRPCARAPVADVTATVDDALLFWDGLLAD